MHTHIYYTHKPYSGDQIDLSTTGYPYRPHVPKTSSQAWSAGMKELNQKEKGRKLWVGLRLMMENICLPYLGGLVVAESC